MTAFAPPALPFPADPLDRAAHVRADPAAVTGLYRRDDARVLAVVDGRLVIDSSADRTRAAIRWLEPSDIAALTDEPPVFLGLDRSTGAGRFACAVSAEAVTRLDPDARLLAPAVDLRSLMTQGTLPSGDIATAATAIALTAWRAEARFCGRCGGATEPRDGGWKRACPGCARDTFPRTDPVVIMLVTQRNRCALARQPHFPEGMWSTIAGFVEPGETIEAAVARETAEELGLAVRDVVYRMSQPWPMPHSLMIGCRCEALSGAMTLDPTEIADARWFARDEAAAMLAGTHPEGCWVPGPHAVAHWLIREWAKTAAAGEGAT